MTVEHVSNFLVLKDRSNGKHDVSLFADEVETLKEHFQSTPLLAPGLWIVTTENDDGVEFNKYEKLEGLSGDVKLYPFVNVQRYRHDIETGIVNALKMGDDEDPVHIDVIANCVIDQISKRIRSEKENAILDKEDFL